MAAADAVAVVLFGALYGVAATHHLPQPAFLGALVLVFALVTTLWVRTEERHRALEVLQRFGRVAFGLVAVGLATPALVLMPVFWLESQLPPEADFGRVSAAVMTLVLISLILVLLVNVVGAVVVAGRVVAGRWRPAARTTEGGPGA